MAITNFIPEIWSASLLSKLRDQLTYAQAGLINRNYEGEIARAGDTVRITSVEDVAVRAYTRNAGANGVGGPVAGITYDLLSDTQMTFAINQQDYFALQVDDIDKRQALSGFVEEATQSAAYGLASKTDSYVAGLMVAGAGTDLTALAGTPDALSATQLYPALVDMRTALTRSNTPADGRWVVVPPEVYALLLLDDRFIRDDAAGTTEGLRNGRVGRIAGFTVIESNVVPEAAGGYHLVAGHGMATTFAEQIAETEALRLQSGFSDAVRGLHVYDGKVIRPAQLVKHLVSVA